MDPKSLQVYYDCYMHATCGADGPDHQKQNHCISNLTGQDLQDIFKDVENGFFMYNANTEPGAVHEFCGFEGQKKKTAFTETLDGLLNYKNMICNSPSDEDQCTRIKRTLDCQFPLLEEFHAQGKC
ncbi:hypothetical protein AVEN_53209-1 [Araneus ventricosus]|uniref:Uncharacterized protein n=1 Tax=Araneus ventricosus TaxID=182803 RepID=A0A4Y2AB46_ARAVE|nr:hypothetical protein AVEN_53209-1 [Araneus ventricosus]